MITINKAILKLAQTNPEFRQALKDELKKQAAGEWAYHGTGLRTLPGLRRSGLIPGASSTFTDVYSEYDDGRHIFFTNDEKYTRQHYGEVVLRFSWPNDAKPDQNIYGRRLPSQYVSRKRIPPEALELFVGGKWKPLIQPL